MYSSNDSMVESKLQKNLSSWFSYSVSETSSLIHEMSCIRDPQYLSSHQHLVVGGYTAHASGLRNGPLIRTHSSQTIEEMVRVVLGLNVAQSIVILTIERLLEVRLAEVGLKVIVSIVQKMHINYSDQLL